MGQLLKMVYLLSTARYLWDIVRQLTDPVKAFPKHSMKVFYSTAGRLTSA